MEKQMNVYKYEGPVLDGYGNILADGIINEHDNGTQAVSEAQARSNIAYRWKIKHGYDPKNMKVVLPGKITMIF